MESLDVTAEAATSELVQAGLPLSREIGEEMTGGFRVEIDRADDSAGGVFISWQPDPIITNSVVQSMENHDYSNPIITRSSRIKDIMLKAMSDILVLAGFSIEIPDEDVHASGVRVLSKPK